MRICLIRHNDLDGKGCGVLFRFLKHFNVITQDSIEMEIEASEVDETVKNVIEKNEYDNIFITDLSMNEETCKIIDTYLENDKKMVLYFDHHKPNFLFERNWMNVVTTGEECGTSLFYRFCIQEEPKIFDNKNLLTFVELVRLYDTWLWIKEDVINAKLLSDLSKDCPLFTSEKFRYLLGTNNTYPITIDEFEFIEKREKDTYAHIQSKIGNGHCIYFDEKYVLVVFTSTFNSSMLSEIVRSNEEYKKYDYVMSIDTFKDAVSLRSISTNMDVYKVAKKYGGGGHSKAAGFPFTGVAKYKIFRAISLVLDSEE